MQPQAPEVLGQGSSRRSRPRQILGRDWDKLNGQGGKRPVRLAVRTHRPVCRDCLVSLKGLCGAAEHHGLRRVLRPDSVPLTIVALRIIACQVGANRPSAADGTAEPNATDQHMLAHGGYLPHADHGNAGADISRTARTVLKQSQWALISLDLLRSRILAGGYEKEQRPREVLAPPLASGELCVSGVRLSKARDA
jgi:hypothetical protein